MHKIQFFSLIKTLNFIIICSMNRVHLSFHKINSSLVADEVDVSLANVDYVWVIVEDRMFRNLGYRIHLNRRHDGCY